MKGAQNSAENAPEPPDRAPAPYVRLLLLPSHFSFHAAEPGMVMFMPTCAQTVVLPTGISTLPFMYHLRSKGAQQGCAERVRRGAPGCAEAAVRRRAGGSAGERGAVGLLTPCCRC